MPKETVYDEAGLYDVQVGWSREHGYVQVGVETHGGQPVAELLAAGGDAEGSAQFTGLWGTFDRAGVNRLVRTLRHARDAAFGRDE